MRIVFTDTVEISLQCLKEIFDNGGNVVAVRKVKAFMAIREIN